MRVLRSSIMPVLVVPEDHLNKFCQFIIVDTRGNVVSEAAVENAKTKSTERA
jgi:hypothetical protein